MKSAATSILFIIPALLCAQDDSSAVASPRISFSGYSEIYYTYDFSNPDNHNRPAFIYSHHRHNEVNLNLGYAKVAYQSEKARANFALMAGTYSNANLAAEPGVFKNIYEANAGVKLSKNKNLWADAGVFSSHIGFESAHAPSCWTLTRSIPAESSPYYESGVKLSFITGNSKWLFSALALNGWQRMQRVDGNNMRSFGTQILFTPNEKITLNSSTFIGNDKPDTLRQMRYFHDFYGIFQLHPKLSAIAGFDYGMEQKAMNAAAYNTWYSPVLILKFYAGDKFSVGLRGEYYSDENGVIISSGYKVDDKGALLFSANGIPAANVFQTFGYSVNLDYALNDNVLWRLEGRGFSSKDKVFTSSETFPNGTRKPTNENYFVTTSLAVTF